MQIINTPKKYSRSQQYLFNLLDNYESEYLSVKRQGQKDTIQRAYNLRGALHPLGRLGPRRAREDVVVHATAS